MSAPDNESTSKTTYLRFIGRVIAKALILFFAINLLFAWFYPMTMLGRLSAYNRLFPGRERLPYGDNPQRSYNLSLFNLEAMFASHELNNGAKPDDEFRVLIIGDSSIWGFLLPTKDTLSSKIDDLNATMPDGRKIKAYNLGYPVMSLTKDLLFLSYGLRYDPDLIIWAFTLESFPKEKQLFPPLLQHNPNLVQELNETYSLGLNVGDAEWYSPSFWQRTIVGDRRSLADLLRLQLYGFLWAATGIDQDIPETYTPRMEDLPQDENFHELQPPHLEIDDLALNVLEAGEQMAGDVPILFVNEPMFISHGENSDIRYNFYYPRWAYDDFRQLMFEQSNSHGWYYQDLWNSVPNTEFTNSAIHLTAKGSALLAQQIINAIFEIPLEERTTDN